MPLNKIRDLRKARGLTLEQLAEGTGISQPHLSRLEANKRMLLVPVAERIARALSVSTVEVLGFDQGGDVADLADLADEVSEFTPAPDDPLRSLHVPPRRLYVVETDAVDKAGLGRGDIVLFDESEEAVRNVRALQIVWARLTPREEFVRPLILLRQFVPPSLLITNSSATNLLSLDMADENIRIFGVAIGAVRRLG